MAIKLEGGRGKALMAWPLVEEFFFCGFPYSTPIFFLLQLFALHLLSFVISPFFVVNCKLYKLIIVFLIPGRAAARPAWRRAVPGQSRAQAVSRSQPARQATHTGSEMRRRNKTHLDLYICRCL